MAWKGMDRITGKSIDETDNIRQSVLDILTTPVGSRVMRRDYGSELFNLLDQPASEANRLRLMAATVNALTRWEPRIKINNLDFHMSSAGRATLTMEAERIDTGEMITLAGMEVIRANAQSEA